MNESQSTRMSLTHYTITEEEGAYDSFMKSGSPITSNTLIASSAFPSSLISWKEEEAWVELLAAPLSEKGVALASSPS